MSEKTLSNMWSKFTKHYNKELVVRNCNDSDNFERIAEIIYNTDKYIYPAAFGCVENAKKIMPELIGKKNYIFSKENIKVALFNQEIVGVSVVLSSNDYDEIDSEFVEKYKGLIPDFSDVCVRYFNEISCENYKHNPYLLCLCVDEKHRGKKVGRALLKNVLMEYHDKALKLHVLRQYDPESESKFNPAIALYERLGFCITEEDKGFALNPNDAPECLEMVRMNK